MYHLPEYREQDPERMLAFIKAAPFALLIANGQGWPAVTQVPILVKEREGKILLQAHIMKKTDHHRALLKNGDALFVFTGPHSYVSASWYSNPQTGSTWNYISLHVRTRLRFLDDEALYKILEETTTYFEANSESKASFRHLPDEYVSSLMKAIVAFEAEVTDMQGIFKLSQNRDAESYKAIMHQLAQGNAGAQEIAAHMQERQNNLFNNKL